MKRDWKAWESARERPDGRVVMRQRWEHLLFLHWPVPPSLLAPTLPPGLEVDTFDGQGWLGVIPFWMRGVRPNGLPAVPGISNFHELNLRTYVLDSEGRPGVWFYSLDCDQALAVAAARSLFHLPYQHARFYSQLRGVEMSYSCQRRGRPDEVWFRYPTLALDQTAETGSLDFFLVERYRLFAWNSRSKRLRSGRVWHHPYRISPAPTCGEWDAVFRWNGFQPSPGPPAHAVYSAGVEV